MRLIEADKDTRDEIGRKAHEPGIIAVIGRAGLTGERLAGDSDAASSAALDHALHHRDDLIDAARIIDLRAVIRQLGRRLAGPRDIAAAVASPRIGAENRHAVAILHSIDKAWRDLLAAVDQHRI